MENLVNAPTPVPWAELRGARVLVTGGSGFFGNAMLTAFVAANDDMRLGASAVVLTRSAEGYARKAPEIARHPSVSTIEGDVRTLTTGTGAFTHVVHGATDTVPARTREDRRRVFDTIVDGTRRVLELARSAGASRFLMMSTGAVYGPQPGDVPRVSEDHAGGPDPTLPGRSGAEAKRAAEALCAIHADDGFQVPIARPFTFLGPHLPLDMHYAIGNFIRDGLRGGPIRVLGDGTAIRSYMYTTDLSDWLWSILLRGQTLRAYNVGSERPLSIREVAEAVALACGRRPVEVAGVPRVDTAVDRYVPDTARARRELGLAEQVPFDDALARTVEWFRVRGVAHVAG